MHLALKTTFDLSPQKLTFNFIGLDCVFDQLLDLVDDMKFLYSIEFNDHNIPL